MYRLDGRAEAALDDAGEAMIWEVSSGRKAPAAALALVPDGSLERAGAPAEWRASGERPCFRLRGKVFERGLPAGWYEIEGVLAAAGRQEMTPCLYPVYRSGADGDPQIPLPDADASGRIRALVLFPYPVMGLRFCPGHGASRFRMGGFNLRRVSRPRALYFMLRPVGEGALRQWSAVVRRTYRYARQAFTEGVTEATRALFTDYRRRMLPADAEDYAAWVARFDTLTSERMQALRARAQEIGPDGPLISILLPVYQTPERWLRRCLDSVLAQVYRNWQLCVADDASPDGRVMRVLEEYAARDRRIQVVRRSRNGHISAASNSALALAGGEYVALLDHDDELRPHALLEMAEAILADPGLRLLYSDEDKIDSAGRRFDPYFKPDWNPDLLRSQNYVCHFTLIHRELVHAAGGFREGYEGSQDHDLVLRCVERLRPEQIRHLPMVLYHWRAIPGSTAARRDAKDYAAVAGLKAVSDHLRRCHPGARAEALPHGHYRVRWPLPAQPPRVSLIVPTHDRADLLKVCVDSVFARSTYRNFELVVVDNRSSAPETLAYLDELRGRERVRVLGYDAPFNYSAINNWAVERCDGAVVALVNNDIEVISPDWLEEMVGHALRPEVGAVGAMLYYPDDVIQHAGVVLGVWGVASHFYQNQPRGYPGHGGRALVAQNVSAVTGACLVVRREVYRQLGGLDEHNLAVAFNDVDFCLRAREAGYRNVWTPFAELYHHESASRGKEDTPEKAERFRSEAEYMKRRWSRGNLLMDDPAYNPNLSLMSANSELAFPPRRRVRG